VTDIAASPRQPALFIPHGGGPCFFMPDPQGNWRGMETYLKGLAASLPAKPRAILVISGHWEAPAFTFTDAAGHPGLIYDYYGFPPETYRIAWAAPGAPWLAERGRDLVATANLPGALDAERGFDQRKPGDGAGLPRNHDGASAHALGNGGDGRHVAAEARDPTPYGAEDGSRRAAGGRRRP